jgi:hybrid cluster-associated redox disulfide protein
MDKYTKGFVVAALIYFGIASVAGIFMGAGVDPSWLRFMHIHFNLLGFMSMMVFGVGYFILPRFNGKELRHPGLLPIHFFAANAGLLGMVATYPNRPSFFFTFFAVVEGLSIGLFIYNLIATLMYEPAREAEKERKEPPILPGIRVGELLNKYPGIHEVFVKNGFFSLDNPEHRAQVENMPVTVKMASQKHGVPLEKLLTELNAFIGVEVEVRSGNAHGGNGSRDGLLEGKIGPDHVLGDILEVHPETADVFRKYYGEGCFSCPGQATETVKMSAMMHNLDEKIILEELNGVIKR